MAHVDGIFVEPLLYDEAKEIADTAAGRERRRRKEEEKARKEEENKRRSSAHQAVMDSIIEYDPKKERKVYTRFFMRDFSVFDINQEWLIGGGGREDFIMADVKDEVEGVYMYPLFLDEADLVEMDAEAAADEERRRLEEEEMARREEGYRQREMAHLAAMDSIIEQNPKIGRRVYTRFFLRDFSIFDIDEESPVCAMRYTDSQYQDKFGLEDSINILSVKIITSDVGYPIDVYGTIIARDSIDYKCVPLFRRGMDNPQRIDSEDTTLILTGPDRGLVLVDFIYLEIDLNIKDGDELHTDRRLGKGLESIDGRVISRAETIKEKTKFASTSVDSWLSTVKIEYTIVQDAVEATVEFKVVHGGDFCGKITASTTGTDDAWLLIQDSGPACGGTVTTHGSGIVELLRRVVVVHLDEMLVFRIEADHYSAPTVVEFPPFCAGADTKEIACGAVRLRVKVTWSLMNYRY